MIRDEIDSFMGLSHKIIKSLVVMDPDLLLQNHVLPPALPEQMALYRHRKRKHPHCQRGVLHSLRLCHYVEQSHRTVSLYFDNSFFFLPLCLFSPAICLSSWYTCGFDAQPGNSEMQRNVGACVCRYSVYF